MMCACINESLGFSLGLYRGGWQLRCIIILSLPAVGRREEAGGKRRRCFWTEHFESGWELAALRAWSTAILQTRLGPFLPSAR